MSTSIVTAAKWAIFDTMVVAKRNLTRVIRLPKLVIASTIQPIMFVLLFSFVFGGAIDTPNGDYINYLLPGILVQTALFGSIQTTIALSDDLRKGIIDRFRSLPMARSAVLAGRTLADATRTLFTILLMVGVGHLVGFRFGGTILEAIGAIALITLFSYAVSWFAAIIALAVKEPETAQVAGFIWAFPLVFASSVFVPTRTMPDWLRTFAENQPITEIVNTSRALSQGLEVANLATSLLWIAGIFIVMMPIAVFLYKKQQ